jgi:antitoxin component HigA of HigAB toxin-antitoxin module
MNAIQYRAALRTIDSFMLDDPGAATEMGIALEALAILCEEYEREHFPLLNDNARRALRRLERTSDDDA